MGYLVTDPPASGQNTSPLANLLSPDELNTLQRLLNKINPNSSDRNAPPAGDYDPIRDTPSRRPRRGRVDRIGLTASDVPDSSAMETSSLDEDSSSDYLPEADPDWTRRVSGDTTENSPPPTNCNISRLMILKTLSIQHMPFEIEVVT